MLINVYWNKKTGDLLIPSEAKTEAGFWLDIEPVEHASISDPSSVSKALSMVFAQSGNVVPTPPGNSKPVVLSYSKAKSWSDFTRKYSQVSVIRSGDGTYTIERYKPATEGRGVVVDVDAREVFPPSSSIDDVVAELSRLAKEHDSE
jgi:hypothetical protein